MFKMSNLFLLLMIIVNLYLIGDYTNIHNFNCYNYYDINSEKCNKFKFLFENLDINQTSLNINCNSDFNFIFEIDNK